MTPTGKLPLRLLVLVLIETTASAWITTSFCRQAHLAATSSIDAIESDTATHVVLPLPEIRWTVPGMKRGWQDEQGVWWDEEGIREGPPMNYWRQKADERTYEKDMTVLKNVLQSESIHKVDLSTLSLQVAAPMLNNRLLGVWAPIVRNGFRVGSACDKDDSSLRVPYTITIARPGLRQLGKTTGYGTFEAHLQPGEPISVLVGDTTCGTMVATKENLIQEIGWIDNREPLAMGNISYLSDYLLVMKDHGGRLQECWARAEPIRSVPQEEAIKIREEFEAGQRVEEMIQF